MLTGLRDSGEAAASHGLDLTNLLLPLTGILDSLMTWPRDIASDYFTVAIMLDDGVISFAAVKVIRRFISFANYEL